MVTTKVFSSDEHDSILLADQLAYRIGVQVNATGVTANSEGRKIIKAGTPLGNASGKALEDNDANILTTSVAGSPVAQGILYRDVDVTDLAGEETANAVLIVRGVVDVLKMDKTVQAMLTSDVKASMPLITFFYGRED